MIKNNNRKPGSINTTPLNKTQHQKFKYQYYKDNFDYQDYQLFQDSNKVALHDSNKVLQDSNKINLYDSNMLNKTKKQWPNQQNQYDKIKQITEQLIDIDFKNKNIEDLQNTFNKNLKIQWINSLNLSENNLKGIPNTIFNQLKRLQKLYLQNNQISKLSFPYFKQNTIKIINISHNKIASLNLEHLQSLIKLQCSHNQITFLTLPPSIQILDCSQNKLSNIYFMENCGKLQEVNMSRNMLYDLKFNFKPYIKFKDDKDDKSIDIKYKYMRFLDCSFNKIVYIEGMIHVVNLRTFIINDNQVSFSRHTINQITQLLNLEELYIQNNPLSGAGFTQAQIYQMISSKITKLKVIDDQFVQEACFSALKSQKKSQFSGIDDEPYNLFMDSYKKIDTKEVKVQKPLQWNFTLGDCQNDNKIQDVSQIDLINTEMTQNIFDKIDYQVSQKLNKNDFQQTYHKGLLTNKCCKQTTKEQKLKLLKSSEKLYHHHQHVYFQPFFKQLLEMSYIPPYPIINKQQIVLGKRLQADDDEFMLLQNMFKSKGGLIYAKKVMKYHIIENGRYIFDEYKSQLGDSSLGFLLNDMRQAEFRQICKFNKLIKRTDRDIIGMQPNVFTCFHVIIRENHHYQDDYYQAVYLIQSNNL